MPEVSSIFPKNEAEEVVKVGKAIQQADDALLKFTKDSEALIKMLQQQNISFEQLTKAQEKTRKTTEEIDKVGKTLIQSEEKLTQIRDKRTKQIIENQRQTTNQRKELNQLVRAQQAERGSIEQLSAVNAILEKRLKSVNIQTEEGRKRAERLRGAIDRNTKTIMDNSSQYSKWKINIGNYGSALSGLSPAFGRVTTAAGQANKAFKLLLANPVVLVISAIVAAFSGLVAIFKSTDDGGTKLQGVFDGIKNVLGVLKNALSQVLEAFKLIRDGKFREAFQKIGEATKFAKDNMVQAYNAGYEYAQSLDAINDRITANISGQAETLRQFREYINLSKDQTLSDQERIDNLNKAQIAAEKYYGTLRDDAKDVYELEVANLASRTKLTAEQLSEFIAMDGKRAEEARKNNADIANAWNVLGDENIKTLEEMYAKSLEADTDYFKRTSEITSLRTGLLKSQIAEQEKAVQQRKDLELGLTDFEEQETIKRTEFKFENQQLEIDKLNEANEERLQNLEEQTQREIELEKMKRQAKFDTLDAIRYIFGEESTLGKAATALMQVEAIKQNLISLGVIQAKQAEGVANAASVGFPWNIPLIAATIAQFVGIFRLFSKSRSNLQGFATGTTNAPSEFVAGEKGRELIHLKTGELIMADNATYFKGNEYKGATVYTNAETEKIIAQSAKGNNFVFDDSGLKKELQLTRKAIQNKPIAITDNSGKIIGKQGKNYREIYLNRLRNGR